MNTASTSWGGDVCRFDWGLPLTAEDQQKLADKKAELGTSAMKDFDFHTAHIFCAITDVIRRHFPEDADEIIEKAVNDYIGLFGQADYDALLKYSPDVF